MAHRDQHLNRETSLNIVVTYVGCVKNVLRILNLYLKNLMKCDITYLQCENSDHVRQRAFIKFNLSVLTMEPESSGFRLMYLTLTANLLVRPSV